MKHLLLLITIFLCSCSDQEHYNLFASYHNKREGVQEKTAYIFTASFENKEACQKIKTMLLHYSSLKKDGFNYDQIMCINAVTGEYK